MESKEKQIAIVKSPSKKGHLREGKGFSLNEIKQADLPIKLLKDLDINIDYFRKSVHSENIEKLKELEIPKKKKKKREPFIKKEKKKTTFKPKKEKAMKKPKKIIEKAAKKLPTKKLVKEEKPERKGTPLTEITGLGVTTANKFFDLGVNNVEELIKENPEELAALITGVSLKRLKRWIKEGKEIIK